MKIKNTFKSPHFDGDFQLAHADRDTGYTQIPNALLEDALIRPEDRALLFFMLSSQGGHFGLDFLCGLQGCSRKGLFKSLNRLIQTGYVQRHAENSYEFHAIRQQNNSICTCEDETPTAGAGQ